MFTRFGKTVALCALAVTGQAASAQTPAAPVSVVVAKPTYISISLDVTVNKPVADVWARVGNFCAIGEWAQLPCTILSGKENELGAVRSVGTEVMVGKTEYSYTYGQAPREGRPFNMYHGTLEARAISPTTTKLVYHIFVDNSMLPDEAAREKDRMQRTKTFTQFMQNMKILSEGGTLPPKPAPAPPAGAAPPRQ